MKGRGANQVDEIRKQETYNMMLETMEKQRTPMMSIKIFCFIKFGTWIKFFYYLWCYYLLGIVSIAALQYIGVNQNDNYCKCMVGAGIS